MEVGQLEWLRTELLVVRVMTFDTFLQRWGQQASILRTADGQTELFVFDQPRFDEMAADFSAIQSFDRTVQGRKKPFTSALRVNEKTARFWEYDESDILGATLNNKPLQKFSWNPVTGEFLFIDPGQHHTSVRGNASFDDYVRGIILPPSKVTFRPFWPTWIRSSPYDEFDEEASAVSWDAQSQAEQMLRKHTAGSWNYQYNINNRALEQMTGRRGW